MNWDSSWLPIININSYTDENYCEVEESIFLDRAWMFAGLIDEVEEKDSFKYLQLWSKSYIVFNDGKSLRCFQNVCSHRGAELICQSSKGNIKCSYHGWVFNSSGRAFPCKKSLFPEMSEAPALVSLKCALVGKFIFITRGCVETLEEYLGHEVISDLLLMSSKMEIRIDRNVLDISANWKVVVENTLESYHVSEVHPGSLAPFLSSISDSRMLGKHSYVVEKFTDGSRASVAKMKSVYFECSEFNDYKHMFVFPNLTVATSGYSNFFIQEFLPRTASRMSFVSHGFLPSFKQGLLEASKKGLIEASVIFNRKVFSEDKTVCEAVQRGFKNMHVKEFTPMISEKEDRWRAFVSAYNQFVSDY